MVLRGKGRVFLATKHPRHLTIFHAFLISFIVVLMLPFVIGGLMYHEFNALLQKRLVDNASFAIQQTATTLDNYFENLDTMIYSMEINTVVQGAALLSRPEFASKDVYSFTRLLSVIQANSLVTPVESQTLLFLKNSDAVVRNGSVSFGIENFFNNSMRYENMDFEEWKKVVLAPVSSEQFFLAEDKVSSMTEVNQKITQNYISYVRSTDLMTFVVLIDVESLEKFLSNASNSPGSMACILGKNDKVLAQSGEASLLQEMDRQSDTGFPYADQDINKRNTITICRSSEYNQLQYISVFRTNEIMKDLFYIQKITIISTVIIVLVGVLFSFLFSKQYAKPVNEISEILNQSKHTRKGGRWIYTDIKSNIMELIGTNDRLAEQMQSQLVLSKALFMGHLLEGMLRDTQELCEFTEYFKMDFTGTRFGVLVLDCDNGVNDSSFLQQGDLFEFDVMCLAVDQTGKEIDHFHGYSHLLENKNIVIVFAMDVPGEEACYNKIQELISGIQQKLLSEYEVNVKVGVGTFYRNLLDVNFSFTEAKMALEYTNQFDRKSIVWYCELKMHDKYGYFYPMDLEQKLISLTIAGKKDEVLRNLHQVYKENFTNRCLFPHIQVQLFQEMKSTILKIIQEVGYEGELAVLMQCEEHLEQYDLIPLFTQAYVDLCDSIKDKRQDRHQQLIEDILEEMQQNFCDCCINVDAMAAKFHVSPAHFSRFFKEQMGEPFSSYLENLRMQRACKLLSETEESVDTIATSVGYNSAYSFRRAFKKKLGVVPTEYRK